MKVKFIRGNHPQFDEIEFFPPEGIEYDVSKLGGQYHGFFSQLKRNIYHDICNFLKLPRIMTVDTDCDLIHSTRGFLVNGNKPWIVDLENVAIFCNLNWRQLQNKRTKTMIRKYLSSDKCKKILPQCEAAKKTLLTNLECRPFENKIETLYLAMRKCYKKVSKHDSFTISFIGYNFYQKGGHDLIEAFNKLRKKYDIRMIMKSEVPKEYQNIEGITYLNGTMSREEMFDEIYLKSDVYAMPTYIDHFGLVYLEAMSAGIPIITTDQFNGPELIDGNGFAIHTDYCWQNYVNMGDYNLEQFTKDRLLKHPHITKQLVEKISFMIENDKLRNKMGKRSRELVENGKFSIQERNDKLKKIYEESI